MKKLIIQNEMDLICLQEILKEYPSVLRTSGFTMSAITRSFIRETLEKIDNILKPKPKD